jgi:hypothetical protein
MVAKPNRAQSANNYGKLNEAKKQIFEKIEELEKMI